VCVERRLLSVTANSEPLSVDHSPGAGATLRSLSGPEQRLFRGTVLGNAAVANRDEGSKKILSEGGFTFLVHLAIGRLYAMAGGSIGMATLAIGMSLGVLKVHVPQHAYLSALGYVTACGLFVMAFIRIASASSAKREFLRNGKEQLSLGESNFDFGPYVSSAPCVFTGLLWLSMFAMGLCLATRPFTVTRLTGIFIIAISGLMLVLALTLASSRRKYLKNRRMQLGRRYPS